MSRIVKVITGEKGTAVIRFCSEFKEFYVEFIDAESLSHNPDADYYASDKEDAISTAIAMTGEPVESEEN